MRSTIAALLVTVLLAASTASAADFTLSLNGVFAPSSVTYDSVRTFNAFAEEGSITTTYDAGSGPGFEAGLVWNFSKSLGIGLSGGVVSRDTGADYDARVPHPLFLVRDRTAEGTLDSLDYQEQQGHLDLVYTGRSGSLDFSVFAGPSYFNVSSDLLGQPDYDQSYPFDSITVTNVPALSFDDTGFGFNVGAGVAYRFSKSVGFGVQGRFSRATLELAPETGQDTVEIDAGGFQIAGGLRIYF
jgi:opacity protein-like surface antigen